MKAEELYGRGGYHCTLFHVSLSTSRSSAEQHGLSLLTDIGNGTYQPIFGHPGVAPAQAPVNYGAAGGNYVQ